MCRWAPANLACMLKKRLPARNVPTAPCLGQRRRNDPATAPERSTATEAAMVLLLVVEIRQVSWNHAQLVDVQLACHFLMLS